MMIIRKFLATASLALAVTAQAAPSAPGVQPAVQPVVHARPALWVIRNAGTTIYLFGTIHKLKTGTVWLEGRVKQAFDASETVVVEVDMSNVAAVPAALRAHSVARDGKTMVERLPQDQVSRYRARLAELGLPEKALDRLQPWAAASMIASLVQRKNGIVREEGVEDQLLAATQDGGKKLDAFETLDQQFGYFEHMSQADQVTELVASLDDDKADVSLFDKMARDWTAGNARPLAKDLSGDIPAAMRDVLVYQRNSSWATTIRSMLDKPGTYFVAIGSGHLVGRDNLRDDLRKLGVNSERLQ